MNEELKKEIKKNYKNKSFKNFVNTYVKRKDVKEISSQEGFESVSEFLYFIVNDLKKRPSCKECGNKVSFHKISTGYRDFCSVKCSRNNKETKKKIEETNLKRYNANYSSQNEEIKKKKKQTNLERYGFKNASQNELVKEKIRNSTDYSVIQEKSKKTNLERYGVEYYFQSEEFKNNNDYSLSEKTKEKMKQTNLEKYGVKNPLLSKETKEKIKKTNLERYGVKNPSQNKEIKEKKKQTTFKNFGVESGFLTESAVEKRRKQDYKSAIEKRKDYVIPLFEEKDYNGVSYENEYLWKCVKCGSVFKSHIYSGKIPRCYKCYPTIITTSFSEKEMIDFIIKLGYEARKKRYKKFEIDAFVEEKNIGFEMNGLYWHSEIGGGKDKNYHINKTLFFKELGIDIFHIFENEWIYKKEIVKSIIKNKLGIIDKKIFARKCIIKNVKNNEIKEFYEENHIQGHINSSYNLALIYNNEIVSALSLSKSRFQKNTLEITRFANKLNTSVIGGFSKLFKNFVRNNNFQKIVTYSDRRFFDGSVYINNGFNFIDYTQPNYYYLYKYKSIFNRIRFQKHKLEGLLKKFDKNLTEWQNMQVNGYDRIWDCGNYKFEYNFGE